MADIFVVSQDPRFGGGVEAQLSAFLEAAASLGRQTEVHYIRNAGLRGEALYGVPYQLARPLNRVDALNTFGASLRMAKRLRQAQSVWVVSTVASTGAAAAYLRRPYACWVGTGLREEWAARRQFLSSSRRLALVVNRGVLLQMERAVLRRASAVYATSPASQMAVASAAGYPSKRIGILPIAVDTDRFAPAPDAAWEAGLAAPVIAFVGRGDDPRKNVELLLDALPLIRRAIPSVTLRLIGRPPAGTLPDGVIAAGEVEDVAEELKRASIFVLPSRQEGFGIVAAEALAVGLPVITTASGGPEALVRESGGGVVVGSSTPLALANAVVDVLSDLTALRRMRLDGRSHVLDSHSRDTLRETLSDALARFERRHR